MRYWDSSAIVPLLVEETGSARRCGHLRGDALVVTWWGSRVECVSALCRRHRSGALTDEGFAQAMAVLDALADTWVEILPSERLRELAVRLLRCHALRAADAMQLAAALVAAGDTPGTMAFVCGDVLLAEAAAKEGLQPLP